MARVLTGSVTVTKADYFQLLCSANRLEKLENGGVDNWEWYGESLNQDTNIDDDEEEIFSKVLKMEK